MSDLVLGTRTIGENASIAYSLIYDGVSSVSTPSVVVYRNGADVTSTVMPSGSHSVSNNVLTLKPLVPAGFGGDTLVINVQVVADGQTRVNFIRVLVASQETGRVRSK